MACYLIDTNVLLRTLQPGSSDYPIAGEAVRLLLSCGETVYLSAQVIAKLWSVATRPADVNGLGWSADDTARQVDQLLEEFPLLPDAPAAFGIWLEMVRDHSVKGKKAHDARLVALMVAHGVDRLLTFNLGDFASYSEITAVHPAGVKET